MKRLRHPLSVIDLVDCNDRESIKLCTVWPFDGKKTTFCGVYFCRFEEFYFSPIICELITSYIANRSFFFMDLSVFMLILIKRNLSTGLEINIMLLF